MRIPLPDPSATEVLGVWLGQHVFRGTWIALVGDLGAGKTALVKAIAKGLGVPTVVQSPTFVLLQPHEGRLPLWHADLYRLESAAELEALALEELDDGVVAIEWADRFPHVLPADHLRITLRDDGAGGRVAEIDAMGPRHEALVPRASHEP